MNPLIRLTAFQAEELEFAAENDHAARDWFEITWRGAVPWLTVHQPQPLRWLAQGLLDRYTENCKKDVSFVSGRKSMRQLVAKLNEELP